MIEIVYNSMVFEILIMEIKPEGPGISLLDTDLEVSVLTHIGPSRISQNLCVQVDFAPPKGYVEPKRPEPAPPETMASKLKIDLNSSTPVSSRPGSSLSDAARRTALNSSAVPSSGASEFESFKGTGQTLNGRKTKGKGKSVRKIEEVDASSKIIRTEFVFLSRIQFSHLTGSKKAKLVLLPMTQSTTANPSLLH
jgi:ubiquitin fusion degradation protein 1